MFFKQKKQLFNIKKPKMKTDYYFHVLHQSKSGRTNSFRIHKFTPYFVLFFLTASFTTIGIMAAYCLNLNNSIANLEKMNHSNRNLKGEVEALNLKIKNIQMTMTQMESLSSKIKKASTRTDDRVESKSSLNETVNNTDVLGIGPLSKEDFELSKHLTGLKQTNLQLKNLFEEADSSQAESSKKLTDFKKLFMELRKYNVKLHLIPDLAPAKGRISSTFGWRMSPFSGKERMHLGVDIAAPMGTPIYATADGIVVRTAITEDYGRMLEIQHTNKLLTRYGHTSAIYVREGQKIKKGEVIGAVGSTGRSTGPHVHYEIEVSGKRIDPETYIVLW